MVLYINPANQYPGVQSGSVLWIKSFHGLIIGKSFKKIFFSESMRPTPYRFGVLQFLVVTYINPANHAPGVRTCSALVIKSFHRLTMEKPLKASSESVSPTVYIFSM